MGRLFLTCKKREEVDDKQESDDPDFLNGGKMSINPLDKIYPRVSPIGMASLIIVDSWEQMHYCELGLDPPPHLQRSTGARANEMGRGACLQARCEVHPQAPHVRRR